MNSIHVGGWVVAAGGGLWVYSCVEVKFDILIFSSTASPLDIFLFEKGSLPEPLYHHFHHTSWPGTLESTWFCLLFLGFTGMCLHA